MKIGLPLLHSLGYCVILVVVGVHSHPNRHASTGNQLQVLWKCSSPLSQLSSLLTAFAVCRKLNLGMLGLWKWRAGYIIIWHTHKKYTNRFPGTFLIQLYIYMEVLFLKQSWHIQVTKFIGVNVVGAGRWDWYKGVVRSLWNKWLQTSDQFSKLGKSGDILKDSVSDSSQCLQRGRCHSTPPFRIFNKLKRLLFGLIVILVCHWNYVFTGIF